MPRPKPLIPRKRPQQLAYRVPILLNNFVTATLYKDMIYIEMRDVHRPTAYASLDLPSILLLRKALNTWFRWSGLTAKKHVVVQLNRDNLDDIVT